MKSKCIAIVSVAFLTVCGQQSDGFDPSLLLVGASVGVSPSNAAEGQATASPGQAIVIQNQPDRNLFSTKPLIVTRLHNYPVKRFLTAELSKRMFAKRMTLFLVMWPVKNVTHLLRWIRAFL
ncbi:MAG: hypothetical protein K8S54_07875 [Spirochaetia bacterium]|nr:hypothetical protein [Spirochaetia bacterium]